MSVLWIGAAFGQGRFVSATIQPHAGLVERSSITAKGASFRAVGASVAELMMYAYDLRAYQVPVVLAGKAYDIGAETGGAATPGELRQMAQKLLEERFRLRVHREKKAVRVYALEADGFKGKASSSEIDVQLDSGGHSNSISMQGAAIADLMAQLSTILTDMPVVDRTGLTGKYEMRLSYTPEHKLSGGSEDVSLATALKEQLGLKAVEQTIEVEMLVVDRIEQP